MSATPVQAYTTPIPILDRVKPMPSPSGMSMVEVWIGVFLGFTLPIVFFLPLPFVKKCLAWAAGNFMLMMSDQWGILRLFATLYGIALACSLSIAIHECGHLVAGLAQGFRCESFRFGRYKIEKGFKISRYHNMEDTRLGWAKMVPIRWDHLRRRSFVMIVAGPLANLLSALSIVTLWSHQSFISASFIAFSVYSAVGSLLPGRSRHVNDGQRIWMLLFDHKRSQRYFAMFRLTEQTSQGIALELLDSASLESACAIRDESVETAQVHLVAYLSAIARKEYARGSELLEVALVASGNAPSQLREMLTIYAAHFQAVHRQRFDLAAQWLAETSEKAVLPDMRLQLEALVTNGSSQVPADPVQA